MTEDSMPTFPPGPRWYAALRVEGGRIGILVVEGHTDTDPNDLDFMGASAVYVFADPITEVDLAPVVQGMFEQTGPTILEAYADRIEALLMPVPMAPGPPGEV